VTKTLSATELAVRSGTKTKDPFCSGVHWMNINAMGSYHILLSNHINTSHLMFVTTIKQCDPSHCFILFS